MAISHSSSTLISQQKYWQTTGARRQALNYLLRAKAKRRKVLRGKTAFRRKRGRRLLSRVLNGLTWAPLHRQLQPSHWIRRLRSHLCPYRRLQSTHRMLRSFSRALVDSSVPVIQPLASPGRLTAHVALIDIIKSVGPYRSGQSRDLVFGHSCILSHCVLSRYMGLFSYPAMLFS